jgi:cell division protein FtsB
MERKNNTNIFLGIGLVLFLVLLLVQTKIIYDNNSKYNELKKEMVNLSKEIEKLNTLNNDNNLEKENKSIKKVVKKDDYSTNNLNNKTKNTEPVDTFIVSDIPQIN